MSWSDANAKISLVHTFHSRSSSAELNETKNGVTKGVVADLNAGTNRDLGRQDRPTLATLTPAPRRAGLILSVTAWRIN